MYDLKYDLLYDLNIRKGDYLKHGHFCNWELIGSELNQFLLIQIILEMRIRNYEVNCSTLDTSN